MPSASFHLANMMEAAGGSNPSAFEALFRAAVREEVEAVFVMLGKEAGGHWPRDSARDYAATLRREREAGEGLTTPTAPG